MSFADSKTYNYIQSSSFILIKIILVMKKTLSASKCTKFTLPTASCKDRFVFP